METLHCKYIRTGFAGAKILLVGTVVARSRAFLAGAELFWPEPNLGIGIFYLLSQAHTIMLKFNKQWLDGCEWTAGGPK